MAKKQSFADKTQKKSGDPTIKVFRVVYPYRAADTGVIRFVDKMVKVAAGENEDQAIQNEITNGRARLEKN